MRWSCLLLLSCGVLLLLFCGVLLTSDRLCVRASAQAASQVEVLGHFTNVKHAGDDAFGYSLRLWKEGTRVFGLLSVYTGAPADPPVGLLEDVKLDPHTGQLSFSARLSTGLVHGQVPSGVEVHSGVASRDRFTFTGVIKRGEVFGTLRQSDDLIPGARPQPKRIRLRRSQSLTQVMNPPPPTYLEWKTWADEILQRRGPKW